MLTLYNSPAAFASFCSSLSSHSHIMRVHPSPHPFLLCTGSTLSPCSSSSPTVLAKQGHSSPETGLVDPEFHAKTHSLLPIILPLSLHGVFACFFEIGSGLQTFICSNTQSYQETARSKRSFVGQAWPKRIWLEVRNNEEAAGHSFIILSMYSY